MCTGARVSVDREHSTPDCRRSVLDPMAPVIVKLDGYGSALPAPPYTMNDGCHHYQTLHRRAGEKLATLSKG